MKVSSLLHTSDTSRCCVNILWNYVPAAGECIKMFHNIKITAKDVKTLLLL